MVQPWTLRTANRNRARYQMVRTMVTKRHLTPPPPILGAVEAMLRPCWTSSTEAADTFLLRPTLTGGTIPVGETRTPGADHDVMVAAKAVELLALMTEKAPGASLVLPLHCLSLGEADRRPRSFRP